MKTQIVSKNNIDYKECFVCKELKSLKKYYSNPSGIGGKAARCKECHNKSPYRSSQYYRERWLKRAYGITVDEYNELLKHQGNKCGICWKPSDDMNQRLVIDHNHKTGEIRGLLCSSCNKGIGFLNDNASTLKSAIIYLEKE